MHIYKQLLNRPFYALIIYLAALFNCTGVNAQVMVTATGKPSSLIVCNGDGTFSLLIANTTGNTMSGAILTLDFPGGVRYTPGSVVGAAESNIGNLNQPVFNLPDILNNTAHTVSYNAGLVCGYTNTSNFTYIVTYNSSDYTGNETPLQNYYYPEPVITNITNAAAVIPVNQTVTRDITIQQQGANSTLDTLILLDEHTADIQVISTSLGTLHLYAGPGPIKVDTIIITGNNFPGGNGLFDAGESIVVSETVKLLGCTNGQSTLKACWGCYDQTCNFYASFPSVSPAAGTPSLTIAFTNNNYGWGFIDNSGWVEFTVTNNGTGAGTAFDLTILNGFSSGGSTYYPNANWINKIDSFSVNGQYLAASYNYGAGALNGQFAYYTKLQFTSDPDGAGVGLEDLDGDGFFDDLPVGKSVTIRAHTYYDWTMAVATIATGNTCDGGWTNSAWQGFRYGYDYKNQCHAQYGVNWVPNSNLNQFHTYYVNTVQHTIPPDLYNLIPVWMEQTVNGSIITTNEGCPHDSVFYKLILPKGVIVAPGTATLNGVSMGAPVISGDSVYYLLNKTRIQNGGLFRVPLEVDCSLLHSATGSVHTELKFWCNSLTFPARFFTFWCSNSPVFGIQCPNPSCTDPSISLFRIKRTTLGWTTNHLVTKVLPTTPGLRLDNALSRDSIRIEAAGRLHGPVDSLYFMLQHTAVGGAWGNQLFFDVLADTLFFFDSETSTWHTCTGLSPVVTNGTTSTLVTYLGNLKSPGNCLAGYSFTAGDSLDYVIYGRVKNAAQTEWRTVPALRANFYWKDVNNTKYCNDLGATFNVLGSNYQFTVSTFYQQIVLQGCTSFLYEGLINQTMESCGGDIAFPNEIRPFLVLDTLTFTLPEGFIYQPGSSIHSFSLDNTSAYGTEAIPDPIITTNSAGTKLIYIRTSAWSYSDYYDCWYDLDRITFNTSPSCKATGDYSYLMDARGRYQFSADGVGLKHVATASKPISYTPPLMTLTPLISTAEGRQDTVSWTVRLCNARSFAANNNWLAFESTSNGIHVTDLTDITNPVLPVPVAIAPYGTGKTWAQLGSYAANTCKTYRVRGIYTSCYYDSLLVRHGYNCASQPLNPDLGYPPSGYMCTENHNYFFLDPKNVSLNLSLTSPNNPVSLCDTLEYEAQVTNSQLSNGYNLKLTVAVPPGVTILPANSNFKFPYTTGSYVPVSDPVNVPSGSNKWVYDISNDPNGVLILKGVDSIPKNGYKLKFKILTDCNFTSGTTLKVTASASNACGDIKTRTSYSQPILISGLPTNVNLYVISTLNNELFYTCGANSTVYVKVINLGPDSVSSIEKLGISIDDAYNYVNNSLLGIHNGPSGLASNNVTGGIRYLNFAIQPNLQVNDSIVFSFMLHDVDPGSLTCDTLPMETSTLLVGKVFCTLTAGDSCTIQSITATIVTERPVVKDHMVFGSYVASSVPAGTNGETVTVRYSVRNNGTAMLNSTNAKIVFIHDANGNGLPDETGADSLSSQTINVSNLAPGDSVISVATFMVPGDKVCHMLAAMRLNENVCACNEDVLPLSDIHLINAGEDTVVCLQTGIGIGTPGITGYSYIWVPWTYLSSYIVSNPVFTFNGLLTNPDTLYYFLTTTRPGSCISRDTIRLIVLPPSTADAGPDSLICAGNTIHLVHPSATNYYSVGWSTSGNGSFDNPALLHPVYTPGSADIANGSADLTMTIVGCGSVNDHMTLHFQPKPTAYAGKDTAICDQFTYSLPDATAGNMSSLNWTTTGDGVFSNVSILHPVYTPGITDRAAGIARLILTASGISPCLPVSDTVQLTLIPPPSVTNNPLFKIICSQTTTGISLTANQTGTTFTWTASLTAGNVTGYSSGFGSIIDQVLTNMDTTTGVVTYTITPGHSGCIGQSAAYNVTVRPLPVVINSPPDKAICSGYSTNIILQSSLNGTSYTWTATGSSPNVSGYSPGSGIFINQSLLNSGWNNETVTYHITPTTNGCTGNLFDYRVTVHPVPDVYFNPTSQTICGSSNCMINLLSLVTGSTFSWTASGSTINVSGFTPGSGMFISQTLVNSGWHVETVTYHVIPSANNCQGISGDIVITVNPLADVSFTACGDIITTTAARPFRLKGGLPPGGKYTGQGIDSITGIFYPALAGTGVHILHYSYINLYSCRKQASLTETVLSPPVFTCGDSVTDIRDGKKYPTVHLGSQCWFAANLNYGTEIPANTDQRDNCIAEKYHNPASGIQYPASVYQWDEIMNYDETISKQGLCPPGWHVPSETDWNALFTNYITNGFAGSPLKYSGYSGYNALLSGTWHMNKTWDYQGFATLFWSSTTHGSDKAWAHGMNDVDPSVSAYPALRSNAFSVRCLKD